MLLYFLRSDRINFCSLHKFFRNVSQEGSGTVVPPNTACHFDDRSRSYSNPSTIVSGVQFPESQYTSRNSLIFSSFKTFLFRVNFSSPQNLNCQMNSVSRVSIDHYHQQTATVTFGDTNQFQTTDFFQSCNECSSLSVEILLIAFLGIIPAIYK